MRRALLALLAVVVAFGFVAVPSSEAAKGGRGKGKPTPSPTVTTASPTPTPTPSPTSSGSAPSGVSLPPSDPAGWVRVYGRDDWSGVDLAADLVPYPDPWRDTSKAGVYSGVAQTRVSPSLLTVTLATVAGVPRVTALQPRGWTGRTYGRFSIRARMDANGPGYKVAWLLWPTSEVWPGDGEIDFPEGSIPSRPWLFMHYADPNGGQDAFQAPVGITTADWHTYTLEWTPGLVVAYIDGVQVGRSTTKVPSKPMRWVIQSETDGGTPPASTVATVDIDWIAEWTRA